MAEEKQSRVVFLKFGKEEHLQQLVTEGEIFCNTFSYFKKKEQNSQRYDQDEFIDLYHQKEDVKGIIINGRKFQPAGPVKLTTGEVPYTHIFCLTAIRIDDLRDGDALYSEKSWEDFPGDHIVLIFNPAEFIHRLKSEIVRQGLRCEWRPIEYVDPQSYSGAMGPFKKLNDFAWQQEYRIAVYHPEEFEENRAVSLKLGALTDIAYGPVHRSKCFNQVVAEEVRG